STSGLPTSPAWMMGSQPASAASACGRSRPWVSEIAPMVRIMPDQTTRGAGAASSTSGAGVAALIPCEAPRRSSSAHRHRPWRTRRKLSPRREVRPIPRQRLLHHLAEGIAAIDLVVAEALQHHELLGLAGARIHGFALLRRHQAVVVGGDEQ